MTSGALVVPAGAIGCGGGLPVLRRPASIDDRFGVTHRRRHTPTPR